MTPFRTRPVAIVGAACQLPGVQRLKEVDLTAGAPAALAGCPPQWAEWLGLGGALRAGRIADVPFDWKKFHLPPNVCDQMHRMERVLLTVLAEALLDAGYTTDGALERCAVYIGATGLGVDERIDHTLRLRAPELSQALLAEGGRLGVSPALLDAAANEVLQGTPPITADSITTTASVAAGRVSALFNTGGGHFAVDAGGASSMAALRLAMQSLALGHCDVAVVAGLSPLVGPSSFALLEARGWLARELHPLTEAAGGTVPAEGATALVLRRHEEVEAEKGRAYAVLHVVSEACDFARSSLSHLGKLVHAAARDALELSGVEPDQVGHLELTACGVPPWEDEELMGLRGAHALRRGGRLSVSCAASRFGYQQANSGLTSVLRAALALDAGRRPFDVAAGRPRDSLGPLERSTEGRPLEEAALIGVSNAAPGGSAYHALLSRARAHRTRSTPVRRVPAARKLAVVGVGAIAPGAKDAKAFWQNVQAKTDAIRDLPKGRFDIDLLLEPVIAASADVPRIAGVVDLPEWAPDRLKLPPALVRRMDPAVLLTLLAGCEALESCGFEEGRWNPAKVRVVIGQLPLRERELEAERRFTAERYLERAAAQLERRGVDAQALGALIAAARARYGEALQRIDEDAWGFFTGATCAERLAARFRFTGGAHAVDAACASSLAAVHAGMLSLLTGETDVLLAGGVAYNLVPEYFVTLSALSVLCARGSFPFDDRAEGFVPAEGAGVVVIKRLEDAEAARDRILSVIAGVGFSSDGKGTSLFAPSAAGQAKAVERALDAAQVDPTWVDLIEAHGSGTRRSDVAEATAYGKVFAARGRDNPVALGSVKSQIGHLSSAGGAMGLIKTTLALSEQVLPPMNGGEYPNPEIPFDKLPLALALERRPWRLPQTGVRRAGVSAFGLGGSNYHLVLEEHDNLHRRDRRVDPSPATRPYPAPARGLFADRWALDLLPLSLASEVHYPLPDKRLLVLCEQDDVAAALTAKLEQAGCRTHRVSLAGARDFAAVEARLKAADEAIGGAHGVVDAMAWVPAEYFLSLSPEVFRARIDETMSRLFGVARFFHARWSEAGERTGCYVALTAQGGDFGFLGDGGNVLGGAISGFLKGLKQELPNLFARVIDLEPACPLEQGAAWLIRELAEGTDRVEVGYWGERRFAVGLRRASFPEVDKVRRAIDPAWVLVFSGGGRGAVFEVAKAIARMGPRVVLTGRTPVPQGTEPYLAMDDAAFEAYRKEEMVRRKQADPSMTPVRFAQLFEPVARARELFRNLAEAFQLGLPVQYEVCDISDAGQVRELIGRVRQAHGRVDGIVHGAMVESSKSVLDKKPEEIAATVAVKVEGLRNLLQATRADDLKLVMCFGSGAGRFGNRGQSDYCAANDLMAKCAAAYAHRARATTRVVTIDWTAWESVGAAARNLDMVSSTGVTFISPAEGCYWFINELMLGGHEREVAIFDERLFHEWPFLGASAEGPGARRAWDDRGQLLVPSDFPLIETLSASSAQRLVATRRFDLERDRFLSQHQLYGVPILPGTFGFELLAEGAALLRPDLWLLRGEALEIDAPVKLFREQPVNVQVQASVLEERADQVVVQVETSSVIKVGHSYMTQTRIHHRGRFVLGPRPEFPPGTGGMPEALPGARARSIFHLAKDPVYLGPLFCRAEWVYVGEDQVEGIIRAPRHRDIFAHLTRPSFAFDPLLLDGAFQVAANWDGHHHDVVSIPLGVQTLERGRARRLNESAHARATPLAQEGKDVLYDVEVRGEDGALLLKVHRLRLRRLDAGQTSLT